MTPQQPKLLDLHLAALVDMLAEFVVADYFRELELETSPAQEPPHDPA